MENKLEKFNPKECHEQYGPTISYQNFGADLSPVLDGVVVTEIWRYWDGVLDGFCECRGDRFFFLDIIESCWRYYDVQYKKPHDGKKFQKIDRLWRVFAAYKLTKKEEKELKKLEGKPRFDFISELQPIGIFWDYEKGTL